MQAAWGRTVQMPVATPPAPGERRAALSKGGGCRGCCHRPRLRANLGRPARTRDFLFSFFLARWCSFGRDGSASVGAAERKGWGRGVGRSQRHTSPSRQP